MHGFKFVLKFVFIFYSLWFLSNKAYALPNISANDNGGGKSHERCKWAVSAQEKSRSSNEGEMGHHEQIMALIHAYKVKLGIRQNPFLFTQSFSHGQRLFESLLYRTTSSGYINSPLQDIHSLVQSNYVSHGHYNERVVQRIIFEARSLLLSANPKMADLQSNLLALYFASEYITFYTSKSELFTNQGIQEDLQKKSQKLSKDKNNPPLDIPLHHPDVSKIYDPSIGSEDNDGPSYKKSVLYEGNWHFPVYVLGYWTFISRFSEYNLQQVPLPETQFLPATHKDTGKIVNVKTAGQTTFRLYRPLGFVPLQPSDPRAKISIMDDGDYILNVEPGIDSIDISFLKKQHSTSLSPPLFEIYTRSAGFKTEEWPHKVKESILDHFSKGEAQRDPLKVARAIQRHISKEYLYNSKVPGKDPITALERGTFRCDMASYIMTALLRSEFGVPTRIGYGQVGRSQPGASDKTYLVVPDIPHSWVEVFYNGAWYPFDPTPIRRDPNSTENLESSEYRQHSIEKDSQSEEISNSEKEESSEPSTNIFSIEDYRNKIKEDTEKTLEELRERLGLENLEENSDEISEEIGISKEELIEYLELGSLDLEFSQNQYTLKLRALRKLLQMVLEPNRPGADIQSDLNQIEGLYTDYESVQPIFQNALTAHATNHSALKFWIDDLRRNFYTKNINETYQTLHNIALSVQVYAATLDRNSEIALLTTELLKVLEQIKMVLRSVAEEESQDLRMVEQFVQPLPGIIRDFLSKKYGYRVTGYNPPTYNLAKDLKNRKLNDMRLLSLLSPHVDFVLSANPRQEGTMARIWEHDNQFYSGHDPLPLRRLEDGRRAFLGQPEKSLLTNISEGTAFLFGQFREVRIPEGFSIDDSERVTVILYDTSGSMSGDPADFQAGLIGAFTAQALSDVSSSGHYRHRVVLVPFDSNPGQPVMVRNAAEALNVVRDYRSKLANTGGGTLITPALVYAMGLIAEAENRAQRGDTQDSLAFANIILMTDGDDNEGVKLEEVYQARQAIDRATPIQITYIAIGSPNPDLVTLSHQFREMGAESGFYKEFTEERMQSFLQDSKNQDILGENTFYSTKSPSTLPQSLQTTLRYASRLAEELSNQILTNRRAVARSMEQQRAKIKEVFEWERNITPHNRRLASLIGNLSALRNLLNTAIFSHNPAMSQRVVEDVLVNFEQIASRKLSELTAEEQGHIMHLISDLTH